MAGRETQAAQCWRLRKAELQGRPGSCGNTAQGWRAAREGRGRAREDGQDPPDRCGKKGPESTLWEKVEGAIREKLVRSERKLNICRKTYLAYT